MCPFPADLADKLAIPNNFNSFSDNGDVKDQRGGENNFLFTKEARLSYVRIMMDNCTKPYSYVKHLNFLDFTEFNLTNPVYVNFVRHPVDRIMSWYYYHRTPWHIIKFDPKKNESSLSSRHPPIKVRKQMKVKGAVPLCNLSVWEPRFGGFTWGRGPGWYHQGPV